MKRKLDIQVIKPSPHMIFFLLLFYDKLQTIGLVERYQLQIIFKKGNM